MVRRQHNNRNPHNAFSIGQDVTIARHRTYKDRGIGSYEGRRGKIQYATSIMNEHGLKLYEQVLVAIHKGPVVILKLGPDKITVKRHCNVCGERISYCECNACDGCGCSPCEC